MPDYQSGKIYKLISANSDLIYIGSTTSSLAQRLATHHSTFKAGTNHTKSSVVLALGDHRIILLESFPCNTKDELTAREQFYIDQHPNCVNRYRATTGIVATSCADYNKQYNQKYRAERLKAIKVPCECHCGGRYTYWHKARHLKSNIHLKYVEAQKQIINSPNENVAVVIEAAAS